MRTTREVLAVLGVMAALVLDSSPAHGAEPTAADRETTRALLAEGDRLVTEKDYAGALRAYEGAAAIIAVPTTVIEVGRAQEAMGALVEARDTYLRAARIAPVTGEPAPFAVAREEAAVLAEKLVGRIPSLLVRLHGLPYDVAPAVIVDGEQIPVAAAFLPRRVNPGPHTVLVRATGYLEARQEVVVVEGASCAIDVNLVVDPSMLAIAPTAPAKARPSPPPVVYEDRRPTLMYAGFGVGAVGLAVGTVFGLMSLSRVASAREHCISNHCTSEARSDRDAAIDLANVANVAVAVAVVGGGVGIYALLTKQKPRPTSLVVTPLGARGSF